MMDEFGTKAITALGVPDEPLIVKTSGWREKLLWKHDAKGNATALQNHHSNVTEILTNDERWVGCISLNEFSQIAEFVKQPPHEPSTGVWLPRAVNDPDITFITNWIAHQYRIMAHPEMVGNCVTATASRNRHHPVRKYLEGLEWDGIERLSSWLEDFCGARATGSSANYIRNVGRAWMISAVARIYRPGCKADHVLILEGPQGILKSTVFKTLADPWFTDQVASLDSKDSSLGVHGMWVIELAELDAMSRHEVGKVKAFLTVVTDRIRPPYGHNVMQYDRQCVFGGTVNHTDYLRDETGNRRFWPVRCATSKINIPALAEARDQLWAEAVAAYRAGEIWWLEDETAAREEQDDRMQVDVWEEPISAYLAQVAAGVGPVMRERPYVTLPDVLKALQIPVERQGLAESRRAVAVLKRLGWLRRQVRNGNGVREWRYMKEG
jgi:putative DNA primase/helicase